jgi:hypothetical protein
MGWRVEYSIEWSRGEKGSWEEIIHGMEQTWLDGALYFVGAKDKSAQR